MSGRNFGDLFAALCVVAIIYMIVRPSSPAAELFGSLFKLITAMVKRVADIATG